MIPYQQVVDIEQAFCGKPGEFEVIDELSHLVAKPEDYVRWSRKEVNDHMKKVVLGIKKWCKKQSVDEFVVSSDGLVIRNKTDIAMKKGQRRGSRSDRTRGRGRGRGRGQGKGARARSLGETRSISRSREAQNVAPKSLNFEG